MTNCQKNLTCGIFLKRGLFKNIKTDITKCLMHKYTNTAYDEVPERPNMWYIFEKRIVQGYQRLYSHMPNAQIQKYKYKIHKNTNTAYDEVPERPNMWFQFCIRLDLTSSY